MSVSPPFQRVMEENAAVVLRFVAGSVGPVDADDVFQETFVSALRAYPALRHHDNLRSWLLTIAHRKAVDHHRARSRRPVPVAAFDHEPAASDGAAGWPDEELWAAVRDLPAKQRSAVLLRFVGDLSYREIGAAVGSSEDAARKAAADGVAKLRREWTP